MEIINLTPHDINLILENETITLPPSGMVARIEEIRTITDTLEVEGCNIPVSTRGYGGIEGLPDPEDGKVFIVSVLVAQALNGCRTDIFCVDDVIRDESGRVIGCRCLSRNGE